MNDNRINYAVYIWSSNINNYRLGEKEMKTLEIPIYDQCVYLIDKKELVDIMGNNSCETTEGTTLLSEDNDVYIYVKENSPDPTIVHEAIHATFFIANNVFIEVQAGGTNEPFCYLAEFIYKGIKELLAPKEV